MFKATWVWREAGKKAKQTSKEERARFRVSTRAPHEGPQMLQGRG